MTERHPIWVLLDKLQMDNRAQAAKLTELRTQVAQLKLEPPKPFDPVNHIWQLIRNGVIHDAVDLDAELAARPELNDEQREILVHKAVEHWLKVVA